jgi:hypothetical protein
MPTDHQRECNRAKQKRFRQRHPGYNYRQIKRKRILNPVFRKYLAKHRTFELADPRDADRLPRVVGYCRITLHPAWSALWAAKDISRGRWAAWLRELAALDLVPVERFGWACGLVLPINRSLARRLVAARIRQISQQTTGDPRLAPPWLLRTFGNMKGRHACPVGRLFPDGRVERFRSIREAAERVGPSLSALIVYWVQIAGADSDGCVWFDD